jgi:pimeloyl-ACP methyl ester carboxylesterase
VQAILVPGGVLPAAPAYSALVAALGPSVDARFKDLEIYAQGHPPAGGFLDNEVDGILAFADEAGFGRFHLVGYSAGGASALAFCAAHPERLASLTLNEPAWIGRMGRTPLEEEGAREVERIHTLPPDEQFAAFVRLNLAPGVEPPPPPPGPPPPWMASRLAAFRIFGEASRTADIDHDALREFRRPVLYTLGGRSHPTYRDRAERLARVFADFALEEFPERHHFDPPHRTEPERFAKLLRPFWDRAEQA